MNRLPAPSPSLVATSRSAADAAAQSDGSSMEGTTPPAGARIILGLGIAFMAFLVFDQSHWWRIKPDYAFGWLVPLFVGYVMRLRWPELVAAARASGPSTVSFATRLAIDAAVGTALLAGCLLFLLGALYRAGSGPTQPGSFVLAAGFAAIFPAVAYFAMPAARIAVPAGKPSRFALMGNARIRGALLMLFPAGVWLISAPLVSAFESALSLFLLRGVVSVVFTVFSLLGYPLVQEGNVLVLPLGRVGVADACSGIRSLTACLFAGTFLAVVSLERFWQKVVLVATALVLAFGTNLLRSLFLTGWAYAHGSDAIEGPVHDATGYAVLGLTVVGLLAILPLFRRSFWRRLLGLPAPPDASQP